ncbi:hypothetical protein MOKP76_42830 [Mycobacterium avium subsp. hominissuis]
MPDSEGPNVPMIRATIWRESHSPHARSGGITLVIGRRVYVLTAAAPRDRNDPRAGTPPVMQCSQHQMVTLVNGSFWICAVRVVLGGLAGRLEYDADHLDDASRDINAMIGTTNG